jgi:2-dehydropantoate 2-reductase
MRLLIVGAGSTGGYFGARLVAAERDVTFLVRPARAAHLRTHGLQIVSPHGDLAVNPKLVVTGEIDGPYDAVLLAVKAFSLDAAIDDLAPAVGPRTMILPVLNGMKHMDVLSARFGATAVVGGLCLLATTIDDQGRIVQLNKMQELVYGERDGSHSPRIPELDAFLQGGGFPARLSDAVEREMWEKWVLLASLGGITCTMRGSIGEIEAVPGGAAFELQFFEEVVSVIKAVGKAPSDKFLENAKATLTTKGSPFTSSMYRDLLNGGQIEADQIVGDLLARGQAGGVPTPLLAIAYSHLSVYQNRLKSAK